MFEMNVACSTFSLPGIQKHTSHHPLAYSEAARYDGRRKTTVGKTWKGDEKRRIPANINKKVGAFRASGKSHLHKYASAEDECVELPPEDMDKEVLLLPFRNGDKIVAFLRAVRKLYSVAVRKIL